MSQKPNLTPPSTSEETSDSEEEQISASDSEISDSEEKQISASDSEISDSDSGQKPKSNPNKTLTPPSATKPQPPHQSSSESEESGSESDSDSPPKKLAVAAVDVKPINSIPMTSKSVKNDGSKPISKSTSSPAKPPAKRKRPPPPAKANGKDTKKAKPNSKNMVNDDKDMVMKDVEKKVDIPWFVRYNGMIESPVLSNEVVIAGMELVEGSKRAELEEKWRKLKEREVELYVKRMELLREHTLVVLEAVRSS